MKTYLKKISLAAFYLYSNLMLAQDSVSSQSQTKPVGISNTAIDPKVAIFMSIALSVFIGMKIYNLIQRKKWEKNKFENLEDY